MFSLMETAWAEGAEVAAGSGISSLLPMLLVLGGCMYFMVIRPQNRRQQEQEKMLSSLKVGDEVLTAGGILASISKITEQYVILQLAKGSEITVQKGAIAQVLPKGTIEHVK